MLLMSVIIIIPYIIIITVIDQWLLLSTEIASRPVLIAKVLHLQYFLMFFIFHSCCLLKDFLVVSLKLNVTSGAQFSMKIFSYVKG